MAYLPSSPSIVPAATRLFEAPMPWISWSSLQTVGGQFHRIDDRLDKFVARALDGAFQHARHLLDAIAQILGRRRQRALRHMAGKRHDEHRKFRDVHLVDGRFLDPRRQVPLGILNLVAGVDQRVAEIGRRVELDENIAAALIGGRLHLLQPLEVLQLRFDGPEQQALGILGRNALVDEADIHDRNGDVRFGLLRHRLIRERSRDDQKRQHR